MYLGIDIGTTATKAVLADSDQHLFASATATYVLQQPVSGVSECDPMVWIDAIKKVVAELRRTSYAEMKSVRAIGLSGQMHSIIVMDESHRVIRPAILWNDERGGEESHILQRDITDIGEITGVVPMQSFSASKLLWIKRNHPADFARIKHILWAKDFVRLWLTGELVTDMSDAGGSQLLDQQNRCWSEQIIHYLGLEWDCLPRLVEGTEISGILGSTVAAELGLSAGIPVAAGGGDTPVGGLGLGCIREGTALISLGTGAVYYTAQESYRPQPKTLLHTFAHCVPDRWYRMAAMLNGASCLAWAARLCNEADIGDLLGRVEARGNAVGRVLFQPFLRGERTPHNDVVARGAFIGLDTECDSVDLAKAVLEGVAFSLRQGHELLTEGNDTLSFVGFIGGGARSLYWTQLIATVLNRPISIIQDAEFAASLGAVRLAMVASGNADLSDVAYLPNVLRTVDPDLNRVDTYAERFDTYLEIYPALRPFTGRKE